MAADVYASADAAGFLLVAKPGDLRFNTVGGGKVSGTLYGRFYDKSALKPL